MSRQGDNPGGREVPITDQPGPRTLYNYFNHPQQPPRPRNPYNRSQPPTTTTAPSRRFIDGSLQPPQTAPLENNPHGDSIYQKNAHHFRIFGGNVNGLSPHNSFASTSDLGLKAVEYQADALSMIETNVDFHYKSAGHVIRKRLAPAWERQLKMVHGNSQRTFDGYYQPGGVCQIIGGAWINRITVSAADESTLGQWVIQTIQGKGGIKLSVITAYQVCQGGIHVGEKTTWTQRQSILTEKFPQQSTAPDPRKYFSQTITTLCQQLTREGQGIILLLDANSDLIQHNSWLQRFVEATGMSDVFTYRHGNEQQFATYKRGTSRIDYMFASASILHLVTACGYLEFDSNSDHRAMFLDIDLLQFLNDIPLSMMTTQATRSVCSRNKKQSREYKHQVLQSLTQHRYAQRIARLISALALQNNQLTPENIEELEEIDSLITRCMLDAEKQHEKSHDTPWSPTLLAFVHTLAYWSAWVSEIRTGTDLSQQRAFRITQLHRTGKNIPEATGTPPSLATARLHQRICKKELRQASKRALILREEWLLEQADLAVSTGDKQKAKILRNIRKSEIIRQTHATVRTTLNGRAGGSLSSLIYPDTNGTKVTTFDAQEIIEKLIQRNMAHFHQADGTPFTDATVQTICNQPLEQALDQLSALTGKGDDAFDTVIKDLHLPRTYPDADMGLLDGKSLASKYGAWKESTSTSPSNRHLGLYRAILRAPNPELISDDATVDSDPDSTPEDHGATFFHCLAQLINICVRTGHVLPRWKTIVSVMLEKIPTLPMIEKLRVIHLFESDLNAWAGIVFGRRMMHRAELLGALGEEQGGSRKGRSSVDVYAMKSLTFQTSELTRTSLAVMDNDAKACYDRIVMALATKRCESLGVPFEACRLFENFLDTANYHISTKLGISTESYCSSEMWKLHGPGQGNQCSPAIWAVVSTLILQSMKSKFSGTSFTDPQQQLQITHHMQAFVDDSSIWVNNFTDDIQGISQGENLLTELQTATTWWEKLLTTTGGKLELTKCFFYFLDWKFNTDGEPYLSEDLPPAIVIPSSTDGKEEMVDPINPYTSHRTLGFQARPINDYKDQLVILCKKSQQVTRALYAQKLEATTSLNAYHSVFVPRVGYVFPLCGLTKANLNKVQSGPLNYTLRALGYPCSFPRAMVFLPKALGGIGFNRLFTEQGMSNILFMIRHIRQQTDLGKFLTITIRWMQLTAGTATHILSDPSRPLPHLQSNWMTQFRLFLSEINGSILLPGEQQPELQRDGDRFLMDIVMSQKPKTKLAQRINRVRLYLQVSRLSDIATIQGNQLAHQANKKPNSDSMPSYSTELWPKQLLPGKASWKAWRTFLKTLTTDGKTLRQPMGRWRSVDRSRMWPALLDPTDNQVYIKTATLWDTFLIAYIGVRGIKLNRSTKEETIDRPEYAIPLHPSTTPGYDFNQPQFCFEQPRQNPILTWTAYCSNLPAWEADLLRFTWEGTSPERLLNFLQVADRKLHIVSDGGCKDDCGSFGWVIASESDIMWNGQGTARGWPMSSYRAEAYGRLASVRFLTRYLEFLNLSLRDDLDIATWCDNSGLLITEGHWRRKQLPNPYDQLQPDADAVQQIVGSYSQLDHIATHTHVKGHQDDGVQVADLPWPAQLNVAADLLATAALRLSAEEQDNNPIPLPSQAYLVIDNRLITSKYKTCIHLAAGSKDGVQYLCRKLDVDGTTFHQLDWDGHRRAKQSLPLRQQTFVTKHLCNWLSTNRKKALESPGVCDRCIHCPNCVETFEHILRCPATSQWRHHTTQDLDHLLTTLQTLPDLHRVIFNTVRMWLSGTGHDDEAALWLKGCIPKEWGELMDRYYHAQETHSRTVSGEQWTKHLCQFFMKATHKAWRIRSSLVDEHSQTAHEQQERLRLKHDTTQLYTLQPECVIQYPFSVQLEDRLLLNNDHLSAWLSNHKANILRSHTRWKELQTHQQTDIRSFFPIIRHRR